MRTALPFHSPKLRLLLVTAAALSILFIVAIHTGRAATPITVTTTKDAINTTAIAAARSITLPRSASSGQSGECAAGSGADTIIIPPERTRCAQHNGKEVPVPPAIWIFASVTISPTGPVTITASSISMIALPRSRRQCHDPNANISRAMSLAAAARFVAVSPH
jgi:hypothetical protein